MSSQTEHLDCIEHDVVVRNGKATDEELADIANLLTRESILPSLAGVLADPTQPEAVRLRAFSRAMAALRWPSTTAAGV